MKKIIFKMCILIVPVFLLASSFFLWLNYAYKQTNHWKAAYYNADRFNHVPTEIQLCNIGTSHGCWGLKWEDYPELNAFNFAQSSQSFYIDLIILKHFENKIKEGAIVLIPLSFHQIYNYWKEGYTETYQLFLSKKEYPYWRKKKYITTTLFPVINSGIQPCLGYIRNDIPQDQMARFHQDWVFKQWSEQEMREYIDKYGAQWFFTQNADFDVNSYQKNFDAVCKIVDYCYEHKWQPILITVPVYSYFYEAFGKIAPYQKNGFYQFSKDLLARYPGIPYWDYSHDAELSPNIELFSDDDHLNMYGAEKFTARIIADLRKAGYLE